MTGDYPDDICGAKAFSLVNPPAFLSVQNGNDLNSFTIDYAARNLESDIQTH